MYFDISQVSGLNCDYIYQHHKYYVTFDEDGLEMMFAVISLTALKSKHYHYNVVGSILYSHSKCRSVKLLVSFFLVLSRSMSINESLSVRLTKVIFVVVLVLLFIFIAILHIIFFGAEAYNNDCYIHYLYFKMFLLYVLQLTHKLF